jgi:hypothetical protein
MAETRRRCIFCDTSLILSVDPAYRIAVQGIYPSTSGWGGVICRECMLATDKRGSGGG